MKNPYLKAVKKLQGELATLSKDLQKISSLPLDDKRVLVFVRRYAHVKTLAKDMAAAQAEWERTQKIFGMETQPPGELVKAIREVLEDG